MRTLRVNSPRSEKPVYCIPGNHDDPAQLRRALSTHPFPGGWSRRPGRLANGAGRQLPARARAGGHLARFGTARAGCGTGRQRPLRDDLRASSPGLEWRATGSMRWASTMRSELFEVLDAHPRVRADQLGTRASVFRCAPPRRAPAGNAFHLRAVPAAVGSISRSIPGRPPIDRLTLLPDGTLDTEVVWVNRPTALAVPARRVSLGLR